MPKAITSRTKFDDRIAGNADAVAHANDFTISCDAAAERIIALGIPCSASAVERYRKRQVRSEVPGNPEVPSLAESAQKRKTLGAISDLLDRSGIDVADVGRVQNINIWQGFYKDDQGEAHTVDMTGIQLSPSWDDGPKWPVVQPAAPTVIRPVKSQRRVRRFRTAVILPDPQIGYRWDPDTGQLDPFHDEAAMDVALQITAQLRPDEIINLGDLLDFAEFSRFEIEPSFARTTQPTIDRAHRFLAEQRAIAPEANIRLIEGNHDRRLAKQIVANAKAAFGLRRAECPDEWPVMSVPYLLRLDDLGVEYIEGYPAGIAWINDRIACVHGERLKVKQVVDDERISIIQGHIHRIERQHKTRRSRHGARSTLAASPGCLCRIDGAVPSTKGSTDSFGRAIKRPEDWQQGIAVVTYLPDDGPFSLDLVPIHDGTAIFRDDEYVANHDEEIAR